MTASHRSTLQRAAAVAVVLALVWLVAGAFSAATPFNADDFRHDWAAGKALARGADFYNGPTLERIWAEHPEPGAVPGAPTHRFLNTPHYAWLALPFSALRFSTAKLAFTAAALLCYAAGLVVLGKTVARTWSPIQKAAGGIAGFAFAPVWFAVAAGQASLIVFGALAAACAALFVRDRDGLGGGLLAVALFKWTMSFLLIPYLAYRRRWKALGVAVGISGIASALAVARAGSSSLFSYWSSLRVSQSGINSPFGPASGSDVSLMPLAARIAGGNHALAYALFGVALLIMIALFHLVARKSATVTWAELALVVLACQLVVYHRAYDAVVVVLAGAVLLTSVRVRRAPWALACVCALLFLVGNAHAPLGHHGRLWDMIVLSHRTWAILGLYVLLWWAGQEGDGQRYGVASNPYTESSPIKA